MDVSVRVFSLDGGILPQYSTEGSAGCDLFANIEETITIQPGERALIPAGIILEIPPGFEGQIRPRSGLAIQHGITVLNSPGTIDSDYRGEVKIILINLGSEPYTIRNKDRIAQLLISPVSKAAFTAVSYASSTPRGEGGFGSTGK